MIENIPISDFLDSNTYSNLFCDYIEQKQSITKFFNDVNIQNISSWKNFISNFKVNLKNRSELVKILNDQNKSLHCSVQTLSNIDLLQNENTFCVLTGQQSGILSGPLYTIYKIITTIQLSEKLSKEFPNNYFVPVFWVESDDHDINEISEIGAINLNNDFQNFKFDFYNSNPELNQYSPVRKLNVNESFQEFINSIFANLQNTEFSEQIKNSLLNYYQLNNSIPQSFRLMISDLFRDYGLILIDPTDKNIKNLLKEIFLKEITSDSETSKSVVSASYELEKSYFAQAHPRAINLFYEFQNGRYAIEEDSNGFFLKGTRKRFTIDELMENVESSPENFSPNVLLRPICQDFLFPTISYVSGPSEIAYFAQIKNVYKNFNLTMPIIYPRACVTLLEEKIYSLIEKFEFQPIDLLNNFSAVRNNILEKVSEIKIDDIFNQIEISNKDLFKEISFALNEIDKTLENSLQNYVAKNDINLRILKEKVRKAQSKKEEILINQILKVKNHIYPQSSLQERKISLIYFLNKYGIDFIKWLYNEVKLNEFNHQMISI